MNAKLQIIGTEKTTRFGAPHPILAVGGNTLGRPWKYFKSEVIRQINNHTCGYYLVNPQGREVDVSVVRDTQGNEYLDASLTGTGRNDLLDLPALKSA